jgi:hypothetical protein
MSRHFGPARGPRGGKHYVVAGYDRPLRKYFLTVYRGDAVRRDKIIHTMTVSSPDDIMVALDAMRLTAPTGLVEAVREDGKHDAGNRTVRYRFDGDAEVLLAA